MEQKACSKCNIIKSAINFQKRHKTNRLLSWCKDCHNFHNRERDRKKRELLPKKKVYIPKEGNKYCPTCEVEKPLESFYNVSTRFDGKSKACKICSNKIDMKYKKDNKKYKEYIHKCTLKRKFNLSLDEYNQMFTKNNGCCYICNRHQTSFKTRLAVDHCHTTGKIRGLLCSPCNTALGSFKDNIDILNKAINYLKINS